MNSSHTVVSAYLRERIPFGAVDGKAITRFAEKVEVLENGCWRWTAAANRSGYGRFQYQGRYPMAHRWAWEAVNGPVPVGLVLDHYRYPGGCIGPSCAHPEHTRPVTIRENVLRGNGPPARNARKTACPRGHPFDRRTSRGWRICTICRDAYMRAYRAARKILSAA